MIKLIIFKMIWLIKSFLGISEWYTIVSTARFVLFDRLWKSQPLSQPQYCNIKKQHFLDFIGRINLTLLHCVILCYMNISKIFLRNIVISEFSAIVHKYDVLFSFKEHENKSDCSKRQGKIVLSHFLSFILNRADTGS